MDVDTQGTTALASNAPAQSASNAVPACAVPVLSASDIGCLVLYADTKWKEKDQVQKRKTARKMLRKMLEEVEMACVHATASALCCVSCRPDTRVGCLQDHTKTLNTKQFKRDILGLVGQELLSEFKQTKSVSTLLGDVRQHLEINDAPGNPVKFLFQKVNYVG